jgi:hypothetical protein
VVFIEAPIYSILSLILRLAIEILYIPIAVKTAYAMICRDIARKRIVLGLMKLTSSALELFDGDGIEEDVAD